MAELVRILNSFSIFFCWFLNSPANYNPSLVSRGMEGWGEGEGGDKVFTCNSRAEKLHVRLLEFRLAGNFKRKPIKSHHMRKLNKNTI